MIECLDLGLVEYQAAVAVQEDYKSQRLAGHIPDTLLLLEHPATITRGRRNADSDFLASPQELTKLGIAIHNAKRGGRLTYHGPGQIIGYLIFSLRARGLKIPKFVRKVEDALMATLQHYRLKAQRQAEHPGVWIEDRKIASLGFWIDRGISMHGLALNVDPQLEHFKTIHPCGLANAEISSIAKELGQAPALAEVKKILSQKITEVFS